jgi:hypothetical protein
MSPLPVRVVRATLEFTCAMDSLKLEMFSRIRIDLIFDCPRRRAAPGNQGNDRSGRYARSPRHREQPLFAQSFRIGTDQERRLRVDPRLPSLPPARRLPICFRGDACANHRPPFPTLPRASLVDGRIPTLDFRNGKASSTSARQAVRESGWTAPPFVPVASVQIWHSLVTSDNGSYLRRARDGAER